MSPWRISVAPMMDCTDRHCRYFLRRLAPDVRLYTEMLTAQALVHGDRDRLLRFDPAELPLAVQLGGSDPALLARAAAYAAAYGYEEINLNVGCPSPRVSEGAFGACLMKEPSRVAACVAAMGEATSLPITVKTRIGVDDLDDYEYLAGLVSRVADAGCQTFVIHARKAFLAGLSPRENRTVPPLRYDVVYRLKSDFPQLCIVLNGGVDTVAAAEVHLERVDGVMIGRKAYADPCFLMDLQARFPGPSGPGGTRTGTRHAVVEAMYHYAGLEVGGRTRLQHITRHMLGLYNGEPGARAWRRYLSTASADRDAEPGILLESLRFVDDTSAGPGGSNTGTSGLKGVGRTWRTADKRAS